MKKKKRFIVFLASIFLGVMLFVIVPQISSFLKKKVVYLTIVGPMSGPKSAEGEAMRRGVELYLDKLRKEGGLPDKRIKLFFEDDQNDPRIAAEIASKIAQENKTLLVLGHSQSSTSIAAGSIYRKHEIPAITASATAEAVTFENAWYFRVIPNIRLQANFIAHYIKSSLKKDLVSIIAVKDNYGASLARIFKETAKNLGIRIVKEWEVDLEQENLEQTVAQIIAQLNALDDPGIIFLATYGGAENVKIITALKDMDKNYMFIGSDHFSNSRFLLEQFNTYPRERDMPGYYSNGIYAVSPFMMEIADKEAYDFEQEFEKRYQEKPLSWYEACYYDAMHVAVEVIKSSEIMGKGHIRGDREKIREALANIHSLKYAIKGVTGYIYFDENGDMTRPFAIGYYRDQLFLPAFIQYQTISDPTQYQTISDPTRRIEILFEEALTGKIMQVNNQMMSKTQIVRAGFKIQEVSAIDLKNSRYTVDFFLWFRFQGNIDAANINFVNAVTPIRLEQPISAEAINDVTTQVYRVKGEFITDPDFRAYPVDTHTLSIKFRHANQTRDSLVYVPDTSAIPLSLFKQLQSPATQPHLAGWEIMKAPGRAYQDVISNVSTLGNPDFFGSAHTIAYSRFNVDIRIQRNNVSLLVQLLTVLIALFGMLCVIYMMPPNWLESRIVIAGIVLTVNTFLHIKFLPDPYIAYPVAIEYPILGIYGLCFVATFLSISAYAFYQRRLALVKGIYLFETFSDKMKSALSKKMRRRRFRKPGKIIIRQGDPGDSLFVIIKGEVSVWLQTEDGKNIEFDRMRTGDFFGELALLMGGTRTASIIAETPTFLGEITKEDIIPFLKKRPDIVQYMSAELTRRRIHREAKKDPVRAQQIDKGALAAEFSDKIERFLGFKGEEPEKPSRD